MKKSHHHLLTLERIKEAVLLERDLTKDALDYGKLEMEWGHLLNYEH